ncbi:MAG: hypothetical protein IPM92_17135 [Saprospiraceae bacterium]|nr:hypothetical protein [Saprospiraceae bacterium]
MKIKNRIGTIAVDAGTNKVSPQAYGIRGPRTNAVLANQMDRINKVSQFTFTVVHIFYSCIHQPH